VSIPSYDSSSAAASVIMSRETRSKPFLFVEGICEVRLLSHHYPEHEKQFIACGGYNGVKEAIKIVELWEQKNKEKLKVLGFIDRDYGSRSTYPRMTVTNNRDVEIDMYLTDAGVRMLKEKASASKCADPRLTIDTAINELRTIGLVRKYNSENEMNWDLNNIDIARCVKPCGAVNCDKYIQTLLRTNSISPEDAQMLKDHLAEQQEHRNEDILRGHDLSVLIGKWLRQNIGNRTKAETAWGAIEENLRLATNLSELSRYNWARRIKTHLSSE